MRSSTSWLRSSDFIRSFGSCSALSDVLSPGSLALLSIDVSLIFQLGKISFQKLNFFRKSARSPQFLYLQVTDSPLSTAPFVHIYCYFIVSKKNLKKLKVRACNASFYIEKNRAGVVVVERDIETSKRFFCLKKIKRAI